MLRRVPWILATILRIAVVSASEYSPYSNPLFGLSNDALLVKRQGCEAGLNSCSSLGSNNVCCPSDTTCALDQAGHIACCPSNAVCTGTIAGSITGSVTSSATGSGTTTTTSSGVFSITGVIGGGSTVTNPYYPFIYAPTSFPNADLCSSAFTSCQSASTACFTSLAGANGVTIGGLGGGITVQGVSGTILSSASAICSSLSSVGCSGLQDVSQCTIFGSGSGVIPTTTTTTTTGTNGIIQVGNQGPRQTACPRILYAAGAGAAIGAMRGII
ncbi:uncharacterized protein A1O5_05325 [Cladophialophora psammophila CBS 110553]|uniref:Hydrophobin n=1 Tax=Cladophialophora psammophila CBS 110553 TaxID=1182543 RepID=W9WTI7_9EURO|nr:uncharacterized protein A1O5_05325 [Cladophialophora psammophila CBS 110553]EXJ71517.1 hypothetical protein A1O5_05325 [Cladophialophora psammophila CBS 110553]